MKFPKPTFVTVDEQGCVVLEYCQKDRRMLIMTDNLTDENGVTTAAVYVSFVSRTEMWVEQITDNGQVARFLRDKMELQVNDD